MSIIRQMNNLRLVKSVKNLYVIEQYLSLKNQWVMIASYYSMYNAINKYNELFENQKSL